MGYRRLDNCAPRAGRSSRLVLDSGETCYRGFRQQQIKFFVQSRCVSPDSIMRALFATSFTTRQNRPRTRPFKSFGAGPVS